MLVSYKWLQRYFDAQLPEPGVIADALMFGVFEIDGVEKKGDDTIFDVKVTPNRAHDCLSHRGVAREIATLTDADISRDPLRENTPVFEVGDGLLNVTVEDYSHCPLYGAMVLDGVRVGPSPSWLKEHLESIGQRSINNIVDATNFVMFDLGTPLHVFDAQELKDTSGNITIGVRAAKSGETAIILGGREVTLTEAETVITDSQDTIIALAGVKGGTKAELKDSTTTIVIEAAKFDATRTRKAAQRLDLRTDASKRYENEIADELPLYGLKAVAELIQEIAGGTMVASAIARKKTPAWTYKVGTSAKQVNDLLGTQLSEAEIQTLLDKLAFKYQLVDVVADVIERAKTLLGAKYKRDSAMRTDAPHVFSCSSLTNYLYVLSGVAMPSVSIDQYVWGEPVLESELAPGDLIFINSGTGQIRFETVAFNRGTKVPEGVDHVGLYMGDGNMLHASMTREEVVIDSLQDVDKKTIVGYRRVVLPAEKRFVIDVPFERLDVRLEADLIEEIGRVYGYERVGTDVFDSMVEIVPLPIYFWSEKIRSALMSIGFTEVSTYTLTEDGVVALKNSIAPERSKLRASLTPGLIKALDLNEKNAPVLGADVVKIFEIGTAFPSLKDEMMRVAIGVRAPAGKKKVAFEDEAISDAKNAIETALGVAPRYKKGDGVIEFCLTDLLPTLTNPTIPYPPFMQVDAAAAFKPFSAFPFALRDIALWVPDGVTGTDIRNIIEDNAGDLLVRIEQFDEFKKDGRTSYAFHLVFQSMDKTLSDVDIDPVMATVSNSLMAHEYEIR